MGPRRLPLGAASSFAIVVLLAACGSPAAGGRSPGDAAGDGAPGDGSKDEAPADAAPPQTDAPDAKADVGGPPDAKADVGGPPDAKADVGDNADAPPDAGADANDDAGPGAGTALFAPCGAMGISQVKALAYLPAGGAVVAGLGGAVAKLIDPVDGRELRTFLGHAGSVNAVAVSADGATLVTASADRTVKVWRVSDGVALATLAAHGRELLSVALSPDGASIAAGAADGEVFLWSRATGTLVKSATDHVDEVRGLAFAAGGARLFTASKDGTARAYAAATLAPLATAVTGATPLTVLAASADGARVAVGDADGGLTFLRAADAGVERKVKAMYAVGALAFAPDGARVYAVYGGDNISAFPVSGGPEVPLLAPLSTNALLAVAPDGKSLFVATDAHLWLVDDTGKYLRDPLPQGPFAQSLAFWPDGSRLAVGGGLGFVVRAVPGGAITAAPTWDQSSIDYARLAISPDGQWLASADDSGAARLWPTSTWKSPMLVKMADVRAQGVAFSPDGTRLAVAGTNAVADVYRVPSAAHEHNLGYGGMFDAVRSVAFSPDGALVAVGTENHQLGVVRTSDWSDVRRVTDAPLVVADLAFSPDGKLLVSTGWGHVTVWQVNGTAPGNDLFAGEPGLGEGGVAISADGTLLVAGGADGQVRLWSLPELSALPPLPSHGASINALRLAPDGKRFAAAYTERLLQRVPERPRGFGVAPAVPLAPPAPVAPSGAPVELLPHASGARERRTSATREMVFTGAL
jgi:WD40 repeat protein